MTRELAAHHAPETQSLDFATALVVHRAVPGLSIVELCRLARLPGLARRTIEHVRDCPACVVGALCPAGARLAAKISRPRRRRRAA